MKPLRLTVTHDNGLPRVALPGDGIIGNFLKDTPLTTAGNGTILAALMVSGFLLRTGPTGAYTDTLDTGANLDAAFPNAVVGDTIDFYHSNNAGFAGTIAGGTGVTMVTAAGNNAIAANTGRLIHLEKTGVATWDAYVI